MAKIKSLSEQVCDYVLHLIRTDKLSVGDKIDENKLIEELNISRTPIREALIQLASDNLLENVPRKGFFVKTPDADELHEMFMVIGNLDGYAAELAMPNLDEDSFQRLDDAVNRMELAINKRDYSMYYEWQEAFHAIYWDKCGNNFLIKLIQNTLRQTVRPSYYQNNSRVLFKILENMNQEHREIVEKLRNKDRVGLRDFTISHWSNNHSDEKKDN